MKIKRQGAEHFVWENPQRDKIRIREQDYWEFPVEPYFHCVEVYDTTDEGEYRISGWYCLARYHTRVMAEMARTAIVNAIMSESDEAEMPLLGISKPIDQKMTRRKLSKYRELLRTAPTEAEAMRDALAKSIGLAEKFCLPEGD